MDVGLDEMVGGSVGTDDGSEVKLERYVDGSFMRRGDDAS